MSPLSLNVIEPRCPDDRDRAAAQASGDDELV